MPISNSLMIPVRIAGENTLVPGHSANRMYSHTVTIVK